MAWTNEQTQAIYKSGSNIIVSAGAGSGKTAVLSERVLQKIISGTHVNELLILTFTSAAAEEMKSRIRKKISELPELKEELTLLDSAYITTFDSYALSIVKKYHYILNIPSSVGITDASIVELKQNRLIEETFNYFYEQNNEDFETFIKKYCTKNDRELKKIVLDIASSINKKINKEEFIEKIENSFTNESINSLIEEFSNYIDSKIESFRNYLEDSNLYFDSFYIDKLYDACASLLESSIDNLYIFSKLKLPPVPRGSEEDAKEYKSTLKSMSDEIISLGKYGSRDMIRLSILDSEKEIKCILSLVKHYITLLNQYKKDNQIYTFSDIAFNAIKIVKENDSIRDEIKYSFKEIMIDEYQDTNDIQDTFIKLIENNNVYMVGDIKQSIYRFNGSNPEIFKEKYDNYSQGINGIKIDLIKNFRSRSRVLDGINDMFRLIMDSNIGGAEYYESHQMEYGNTKYDELKDNKFNYDMQIIEYEKDENKTYKDEELEIFAIANDIKKKVNDGLMILDKETFTMRKIQYSDFAIILDRSKYFDLYKKIFEYVGIPMFILRNEKLTINIDINLIKNIINFIIKINSKEYDIEFKYDFISIARSFLYEYDDKYIFKVFKDNKFKETQIYKDFSSIESFNSLTCGELLLNILDISDFYNKLYKIGDYDNVNMRINTLYDLAIQFNNLGYTIYEFKDYLQSILDNGIDIQYEVNKGSNNAVKLMTIHKSKGLEYPVCYFADLNHKFNLKDINSPFIVDNKYGLIIPSNDVENKSSIVKELFTNNIMKDEISEKIRLFYVALTRAREKIIIVLPSQDSKAYSKKDNGVIIDEERLKYLKLSDMVYSVTRDLNHYVSEISIKEINPSKQYLYKRTNKNYELQDSTILDVKEINIDNSIVDEKHFSKENCEIIDKNTHDNLELGIKFHEILENIDFVNPNLDLIKDKFIREKVSLFLNIEILSNIENTKIYKEYEFIYNKDNIKYHGQIDLMIEHEDYIDIIDYKLKNTSDTNYKNQIHGYKEYISSISNKKVNTYLYSIIDSELKEIK